MMKNDEKYHSFAKYIWTSDWQVMPYYYKSDYNSKLSMSLYKSHCGSMETNKKVYYVATLTRWMDNVREGFVPGQILSQS